MIKKKGRQPDPGSPGGDDSSESGEDNTQAAGKSCLHVARSVELNNVRKAVSKTRIKETCVDCSKESSKVKKEPEEVGEDDSEEGQCGLWLCLRCGAQGCGPPSKKNSHIAKHFATPRSDSHALTTNTDQWSVWCHECECEVAANSTKKLHECIEYLKRQPKESASNEISPSTGCITKLKIVMPDYETNNDAADEAGTPEREVSKKSGSKSVTLAAAPSPTNQYPRVKGLTNLGNTCFFNAVLQCLSQTPFLVPLLRETSNEGESFTLAGCPKGGKDQEPVPPLDGTLGKWGNLTEALADTLAEMQEGGGSGVVTPRRLLSILSQKAPHLSQGDQQDSQELLRHLMEGVRTEELRRFQDKILSAVGLTRKTDPATVDDLTKAKAKVYNHQASQLLLRPDQLFQGRLISTLQCQDCLRQSHTPECFLDLSLPIASDRPQPPLVLRNARREADTEPPSKDAPSKHQLKKERRLAHKNRKKRGSRQNSVEPNDKEGQDDENNSEESKQSDADVEDNEDNFDNEVPETQEEPLDLSNKNKSSPVILDTLEVANKDANKAVVEDRGGGESGYATNGGTQSNSPGSPMSATEEVDPNCDHASALCSELVTLALENNEDGSPVKKTENKSEAEEAKEEKVDEEKKKVEEEPEEEGACALKPEEEEEEEEDENSVLWSQTLAPRPPPSDPEGDCSIQSCLNQFAALELLTGNNKVSCKTCTKRAGKAAQGKTVCTNSTKQLLVSAPPAILTLHLKRFEVCGSRFRKVSRHVSFPLLLDLAPICSTKSRDLPSVGADQTQLLYSLYGVVEHSGALSGGHYVAYVKARPQLDKDDPRYKYLLTNNWVKQEKSEVKKEGEEGAEGGLPEPPPGKWYYISDSRVSEVSEKKVLQTQAYLLFYERIL